MVDNQNFKRGKFVSTKKKFIIAICSVSVIAITLLASLIAVVASFNAKTVDGGFKVSYTAKNVHATIAAEYKIGSGSYNPIKTSTGDDAIVFTGDETEENIEKSFATIDNVTIGKDDVVILHYTITNTDATSATSFKVVSSSNITTDTNVTVGYATSESASTWEDSLADIADVDSVAYGTPLDLYVRIAVATKTKDATFNGQFNFELIVND